MCTPKGYCVWPWQLIDGLTTMIAYSFMTEKADSGSGVYGLVERQLVRLGRHALKDPRVECNLAIPLWIAAKPVLFKPIVREMFRMSKSDEIFIEAKSAEYQEAINSALFDRAAAIKHKLALYMEIIKLKNGIPDDGHSNAGSPIAKELQASGTVSSESLTRSVRKRVNKMLAYGRGGKSKWSWSQHEALSEMMVRCETGTLKTAYLEGLAAARSRLKAETVAANAGGVGHGEDLEKKMHVAEVTRRGDIKKSVKISEEPKYEAKSNELKVSKAEGGEGKGKSRVKKKGRRPVKDEGESARVSDDSSLVAAPD